MPIERKTVYDITNGTNSPIRVRSEGADYVVITHITGGVPLSCYEAKELTVVLREIFHF